MNYNKLYNNFKKLMKGVQGMTKNRLIAILLAIIFIFVIPFSAFFIVENENHDCEGEDCSICYQISICENVLKTVGLISALVAFVVLFGKCVFLLSSFTIRLVCDSSLVKLKVKLSN